MPWHKPMSDEEFVDNLALARDMTSTGDDLLRHNGVTLSRGGPLNPGFLRMREPYIGPYGELTRGREFVLPERERVALEFCAAHDVRLNFIGAGYADHDDFLANAEELASRVPIRHRRWVLQHNYLCTEDHARRYAELGFVVTTSMSFSCAKGDLFEKRIGALWSLANIATLIGLLGTVSGLINTFAAVAAQGLSQADKQRLLSLGIAEAMYNTAFGLGVAVSCMIAHIILHTRAKNIGHDLDGTMERVFNLLTITKYSGFDPEVNSFSGNDIRQGADLGAYPTAKSYTLGLSITF